MIQAMPIARASWLMSFLHANWLNYSKVCNLLHAVLSTSFAHIEKCVVFKGTGVTVNALHPGLVDTNITRHMGFVNSIFASIFVRPLFWPFIRTAQRGAQTTLYVALDPSLETVTGKYFR